MIGWLKNLVRTERPSAGTQRPARIIRARYDAAVTTEDNRRHWINADALSPDAANNVMVRRNLRIRSRYEVANNSYARGIVNTLANDVIGTGPRLQMLTPNAAANKRIEQGFRQWTTAVDLTVNGARIVQRSASSRRSAEKCSAHVPHRGFVAKTCDGKPVISPTNREKHECTKTCISGPKSDVWC